MSSKFFNNDTCHTLFDKLKGIAINMANFDRFLAVVGFFRSSGYFKLRKELNDVEEIKILVGINIDDIFRRHNKAMLMLENEEKAKELYSYLSGAVRIFCQAKAKSIRSCTITYGVEGTYVNNQHYKGDLEKICQDVHTRKGKVYANNYMDFYKDKDGNDLISLI